MQRTLYCALAERIHASVGPAQRTVFGQIELEISLNATSVSTPNQPNPSVASTRAKAGQNYPLFLSEGTVANTNLSGMNVESLMNLRKRVDERLLECRAEIEKQL